MNNQIGIVYVPVGTLQPSEYNPRKISDAAFAELKRSIEKFNLVDPVIVNGAETRKNIVIGGHMRLRAAKDLGFAEVPVVYLGLDPIYWTERSDCPKITI